MRKIVTNYEFPPIPNRQFDWCAYYDGDEESGNIGRGSTEAEAIKDFVANYLDDADAVLIAAAPELLAALIELMNAQPSIMAEHPCYDLAEAAVAKALGHSSHNDGWTA